MKNRINGLYWVVTGLMAAFMLMASIPDVLRLPQAIEIFGHLGYPAYLLLFLGTAKILGVIAVLIPGFDRLKEWAYAGLVFDIIGALYFAPVGRRSGERLGLRSRRSGSGGRLLCVRSTPNTGAHRHPR